MGGKGGGNYLHIYHDPSVGQHQADPESDIGVALWLTLQQSTHVRVSWPPFPYTLCVHASLAHVVSDIPCKRLLQQRAYRTNEVRFSNVVVVFCQILECSSLEIILRIMSCISVAAVPPPSLHIVYRPCVQGKITGRGDKYVLPIPLPRYPGIAQT